MKIEINRTKVIEVVEDFLTVKNDRLFNTKTNKYEAIDGDVIHFKAVKADGKNYFICGTVDGYTCGNNIKLRGVESPYKAIEVSSIDKVSSITNSSLEEEKKAEFEAVLC